MDREQQIALDLAFDILSLPPELRALYWRDVTLAYIRGMERDGHPQDVIEENYNAFSLAIAAHLARLTQHTAGNA